MTRQQQALWRAFALDLRERARAIRFVAAEASRYGNDRETRRLAGKADGLDLARELVLELLSEGEE